MKISKNYFFILLFLVFGCNSSNFSNIEITLHELSTNSSASLRGLYVVDENIIWASGSGGTVLNSTNGGIDWKKIQVPGAETNDFRSIHAWNENRALVFGVAGPAFGYLTEDGGENWNVVYNDTTKGVFFDSVKFADQNTGLAVSDQTDGKPFVIKTSDAGKTWRKIENLPALHDGEAHFAASNTCIEFLPSGKAWIITGGTVARVFYSDDSGENWNVSDTPIIAGNASSGIFSVSFKNQTEGVIVGGTYDKPENNVNIAAYTIDGGKNWIASEIMPQEYRSCVQSVTVRKKGFFLAMGKTGCDISVDNGKTWTFKTDCNYYTFRQIPGKQEGFAAGSNGRIAHMKFNTYK